MLLCIVLSLTEADIAQLQYHGKEQHAETKRYVRVSPTQILFKVKLYTWYESGEGVCISPVTTERFEDFKSSQF